MKFAGGTTYALIAFIVACGIAYLVIEYTDWLGSKDWRFIPMMGFIAYLVVRIAVTARDSMRRK